MSVDRHGSPTEKCPPEAVTSQSVDRSVDIHEKAARDGGL